MKKVAIGFSKPKGSLFPVGSWLIRLYQKSKYSHVYFKFHSNEFNIDLIYEAVGHGVRFIEESKWKQHAEAVKIFEIEFTDEEHNEFLDLCAQFAGDDYGFFQNIGIVVANCFNLKKNPFNSGKNCSELVAKILQKKGYVFKKKDLNLITPKDVYEVLDEAQSKR